MCPHCCLLPLVIHSKYVVVPDINMGLFMLFSPFEISLKSLSDSFT